MNNKFKINVGKKNNGNKGNNNKGNKKTNSNSNSNMNILNIVIILLILIALIFIVYYLINHTNLFYKKETDTRVYNITKGNVASPYLDVCKLGCTRGVCKTKNSNSKDFCKFDFECNYCKDRNTRNFYVDLTNYEEVQPAYSVQKKLSNNQRKSLNNEIEENNEYIDDLNDQIREFNRGN